MVVPIKNPFTERPPPKTIWMITFADLLSLILTFFVMLYAMSAIKQEEWEKISHSLNQRLRPNYTASGSYVSSKLSVERINVKQGSALQYLYSVVSDNINAVPEIAEKLELNLLDDKLVISFVGGNSFPSGSAEMPQEMLRPISYIAQSLSTVGNSVEVVSYADPRPIETEKYPSNWELSLGRAITVANALRKAGYAYKISAFGRSSSLFGDLGSDAHLEKRQELSRRVDIVVRSQKAVFE